MIIKKNQDISERKRQYVLSVFIKYLSIHCDHRWESEKR